MKTFFFVVSLAAALSAAASSPANALTVTSLILFPEETAARDTTSSAGIDFIYRHELPELPEGDLSLTAGRLSLTHEGNLNEGPVREIWEAETRQGHFIGRLGESESAPRTDLWNLSGAQLAEITSAPFPALEILLSEQTAFSREKLVLHRSELILEARVPPETPAAPEPSSLILLTAALGGAAFRHRRRLAAPDLDELHMMRNPG